MNNQDYLRWAPRISRLTSSQRTDHDVIAIMMTESHFRGSGFRLLEYMAFRILRAINHRRADTISLGVGQVQARHWRTAPTFWNFDSEECAYDLIASSFAGKPMLSFQEKVAIHVGEVRGHYMAIASRSHELLQKKANKTEMATPRKPSD